MLLFYDSFMLYFDFLSVSDLILLFFAIRKLVFLCFLFLMLIFDFIETGDYIFMFWVF